MGEIEIVGFGGSTHGIVAIREMNQSPSADAKQGLQLALDIWRNSATSSDAEERHGKRPSIRVRTVGATRLAGSAIAGIQEARGDGPPAHVGRGELEPWPDRR
jgi:hypothetical protein